MQRGVSFYRLYAKLRSDEVRHDGADFLGFYKIAMDAPPTLCGSASLLYESPSGNLVDGLPLVAHRVITRRAPTASLKKLQLITRRAATVQCFSSKSNTVAGS